MEGQTILELSAFSGIPLDTLRKRWARAGLGLGFSKDIVPTQEQLRAIGLLGGEKPVKVRPKQDRPVIREVVISVPEPKVESEEAPDKPDWNMRMFWTICGLVSIGHGVLVFVDCWTLWGAPGFFAGLMAFLIMSAAVIVSTDNTRTRTSRDMVSFVWVLDILALFVHYPAFMKHADSVGAVTTGGLCVVICATSAAALYFYRDSKIF